MDTASLMFENMSAEEVAEAKRLIRRLQLPIRAVETRRFVPSHRGRRVDMRRSFRASLRSGGAIIPLQHQARQRRNPPPHPARRSEYSQSFCHHRPS